MARTSQGGGEFVYHIAGVRLRVVGSGSLRLFYHSLDNVRNLTLLPLPLSSASAIEPTRLGNFRSQRTQLELKTDSIDEYFQISKIVIFAKPSATSLPG